MLRGAPFGVMNATEAPSPWDKLGPVLEAGAARTEPHAPVAMSSRVATQVSGRTVCSFRTMLGVMVRDAQGVRGAGFAYGSSPAQGGVP
jgi:hypothetical protein